MALTDTKALLAKAMRLAHEAHAGQWRYDPRGEPDPETGLRPETEPYIFHPVRVASRVSFPIAKAVALLHDVIEDTDLEAADLIDNGFPAVVVEAVVAMSQRKDEGERSRSGEKYFDYIERIRQNPLATYVKLADLADNSADQPPGASILKRYDRAWTLLAGAGHREPFALTQAEVAARRWVDERA